MSFGGLLKHTIDILRYPVTYGDGGESTLGAATVVGNDVLCLIQSRRGRWAGEQRGEVGEEGLLIFVDHRTDIRGGDVIEVVNGPAFLQALGSSDERWFVDRVDDAGGQEHHIEVTAFRRN
jgi:hypothetical protein|tara:strand:- start:436 stop:798 length:363 start_codon:yes stop_codon:yes gene_type:complete